MARRRRRFPFPQMGPFVSDREGLPDGFTLLEMVVALAIFALAGMALLRLEGATLTQSAQLADRAVGQTVARNLAVEILSDPALPAFGRANGEAVNAGRRWRWQRDVTRTDDVRIARVDIVVTDEAGRPAGRLSLAKAAQ
jgi:general secretion pathway protein I